MAICMSVWCPTDADLVAIGDLTGTGLVTRTGDGTFAARTIVGTSPITVANGSGAAGNPTISYDSAGPWTAIDISTGTVLVTAPSVGLTWELIFFIASSEATTAASIPCYINGESTTTNFWTQQITGTNAASGPQEANTANLLQYTGTTAPTGSHAYNRVIFPSFRSTDQKMALLYTAFSRAAGDAVIGNRVWYRTGAAAGSANDAVASFGYTLPSAGTHAAGSWAYHRWVAA